MPLIFSRACASTWFLSQLMGPLVHFKTVLFFQIPAEAAVPTQACRRAATVPLLYFKLEEYGLTGAASVMMHGLGFARSQQEKMRGLGAGSRKESSNGEQTKAFDGCLVGFGVTLLVSKVHLQNGSAIR